VQKVLTIGSCMVEITPTEAGQTIRDAHTLYKYANGSVSIFASAVARLGVPITVVSRVGADELGEFMIQALAGLGVDSSLVKPVPGMQTPVSFCSVDQEGGKKFDFYRFPGYSDPMAEISQADLPQPLFEGYGLFDFSENMLRSSKQRSAVLTAAARARKAGCTVVYGVNLRFSAWQEPETTIRTLQKRALGTAKVAVMNTDELAFITKTNDIGAGCLKIHELGPELVAVTSGGGPTILSSAKGLLEIPPFEVEVIYDVGAGDCFHGGLVVGLANGLAPASAGLLANAVAAWRVSRAPRLEDLPTLSQVEDFIASRR